MTTDEKKKSPSTALAPYKPTPLAIPDASLGSLEEYIRVEAPHDEQVDPSERVEFTELKETLAEAIDKLPEKERIVVSLYYYEELTMKEISLVLHLSEARICQLHTKAVFRLRGYLSRLKGSLI